MPGLAGFASQSPLSPRQLDARLEGMEKALVADRRHRLHRVLFGPRVGGAAVCAAWQPAPVVQTPSGLSLWLDGRFFNRDDLARRNDLDVTTDAAFMLSAIADPLHRGLLKAIDGLFSAVVFDAHRDLLHLVTDRYGLRPLYFLQTADQIAWASETKAILALPGVSPRIDPESREAFLATGQLPAARTWLTGISPVPPATRLTCRLADGTITRERYWHWHELAPLVSPRRLKELAEELGRRFSAAVARRCDQDHQGLVLSGGLDSRAILAAMPGAPKTFTFGQKNSADVSIAARVATKKGAPHEILPLDARNWLAPRIAGIWWTDGALNLVHMHGVEYLNLMAETVNICFNGAGGDGLAGGGHLFAPHELPAYLRQTLNLDLDRHPAVAAGIETAFNRVGSAHAFYIDWRMRGFTIHGPRLGLFCGLDYRLPFLDNDVQEFLYAIPLEQRRHNRLYRQMLLLTFPEYFKAIPWQATGYPVGTPDWVVRGARAVKKWRRSTAPKGFADYPAWLRQAPAGPVCEKLLLNDQALIYPEIDRNRVTRLWRAHLAGENHVEMLSRYLTCEVYLQQLHNGKFRTPEAAASLLQA